MDLGRMGTTVALEGWERRSMVLMQLVRPMTLATLKPASLPDQILAVRMRNCRPAINSFATQ
jgi:hypothetical protein